MATQARPISPSPSDGATDATQELTPDQKVTQKRLREEEANLEAAITSATETIELQFEPQPSPLIDKAEAHRVLLQNSEKRMVFLEPFLQALDDWWDSLTDEEWDLVKPSGKAWEAFQQRCDDMQDYQQQLYGQIAMRESDD